jgi:stage V sporulation protein B
MGVIVYLIYKLLFTLTRSVFIPLVISIIIGVIVYFVIILFMYSDHPEELESIPYVSKLINKLKK